MPKKSESYEQLLKSLEDIIKDMENNELTLDKSIKNYEEGVKLCNKLYTMLNEAEGKIKILNKDKEENFEE